MRCFWCLAGNVVVGVLVGFGIAGAAATYGLGPVFCACTGLIGGGMAGLAGCI